MATEKEMLRAAEKALVDRCLQRDPDAWADFVRCYSRSIRNVIVRMLRRFGLAVNVHVVDDLQQEVFCVLLVHDCHQLRRFDPSKAGLVTYLGLRVCDRLKDHLASAGRRRRQGEQPLPEEYVDPHADAEPAGLLLEEILARLTEDERHQFNRELFGEAAGPPPRHDSAAARSRRRQAILAKLAAYGRGEAAAGRPAAPDETCHPAQTFPGVPR